MLIGFFYLEFGLDFGRISVVSFTILLLPFYCFPACIYLLLDSSVALLVDQARVQVRTILQDVNAGKQGRI